MNERCSLTQSIRIINSYFSHGSLTDWLFLFDVHPTHPHVGPTSLSPPCKVTILPPHADDTFFFNDVLIHVINLTNIGWFYRHHIYHTKGSTRTIYWVTTDYFTICKVIIFSPLEVPLSADSTPLNKDAAQGLFITDDSSLMIVQSISECKSNDLLST